MNVWIIGLTLVQFAKLVFLQFLSLDPSCSTVPLLDFMMFTSGVDMFFLCALLGLNL